MVDLGQQQSMDATSLSLDAAAERRWRLRYNVWLAVFLIGPGIVAIAIMGWLKTP